MAVEPRSWSHGDESEIAVLAQRLREIVRWRLGESLPADGFMPLGGDLVLWVHGFRFKLTERGDTLMAGRLYPQAVRMDITHPGLGVHIALWRPGPWQGRLVAGLDPGSERRAKPRRAEERGRTAPVCRRAGPTRARPRPGRR